MEQELVAQTMLQYAMYNERLGHRFYIKAMEMTADEKGKNLFRSIAAEEEVHLVILQKEFDSLEKTGDWVTLEQAKGEGAPSPLPKLFPEEEVEMEEILQKRTSDLDALDIALDMERRGYELYKGEAERASDLTAKAIYAYLAEQENNHFTVLEKTRNHLAANGAWLWDDLEHAMLE